MAGHVPPGFTYTHTQMLKVKLICFLKGLRDTAV